MFSQTVEYALRAMVYLAKNQGGSCKTSDIAAATKVPSPYLSKVLQGLRQKGLVVLQRGVGGGVTLAHSPEELSILDIVNAVEPIQRIASCPLEIATHGTRLCSLHRRMDDALKDMEDVFRASTLSEMLDPNSLSVPLCESAPEPNLPSNESHASQDGK